MLKTTHTAALRHPFS